MISLLRSAIQDHLRSLNINPKDNTPVVSEEVLSNMAKSLTEFSHNASIKFFKGQQEHGGDIRDRDLWKEFCQEQEDSFWYGPFGALSWPKKPK